MKACIYDVTNLVRTFVVPVNKLAIGGGWKPQHARHIWVRPALVCTSFQLDVEERKCGCLSPVDATCLSVYHLEEMEVSAPGSTVTTHQHAAAKVLHIVYGKLSLDYYCPSKDSEAAIVSMHAKGCP